MDLDEKVAAVLLPGWAASPPSPAPESAFVVGGEQLVAAVAAGSAASPLSPALELAVAKGTATFCRLCGGLACVAAAARLPVGSPAEGGGGGGHGGVLCRLAAVARPPVDSRRGRYGGAVRPLLFSLSLAILVLFPFSLLTSESALPLATSHSGPPLPLECDYSRTSAPPAPVAAGLLRVPNSRRPPVVARCRRCTPLPPAPVAAGLLRVPTSRLHPGVARRRQSPSLPTAPVAAGLLLVRIGRRRAVIVRRRRRPSLPPAPVAAGLLRVPTSRRRPVVARR